VVKKPIWVACGLDDVLANIYIATQVLIVVGALWRSNYERGEVIAKQLQDLQLECRFRMLVFFFSSRRRHTRSFSAFLLNRSSDLFIPSTFKRPVSSWKALKLRITLLLASSVLLKPLTCSRLPRVYAQETLTFLLTQKKTCVK